MRFLLLVLILADHLVKNGIYEISTVKAHICRSSGKSTLLPLEASSGQNGNMRYLLLELLLADQVQIYPPPIRGI